MAPSPSPTRPSCAASTDQVTYLSASWRNAPRRLSAPAGPDRRWSQPALCIAGHERQLDHRAARCWWPSWSARSWPTAAISAATRGRAGGAAARSAAAAAVLCRARHQRPTRRCSAAIGRMTPMLRHLRLGDGTAGALQRHGRRPSAMRSPRYSPTTMAARRSRRRPSALGLRAPGARRDRGARRCRRAAAAGARGGACAGCLSFELSTGTRAAARQRRRAGPCRTPTQRRGRARDRQPQHAVPRRAVLVQAGARCAGLERGVGAAADPPSRRVTCEVRRSGRCDRARGLARRLRRALRPRPHAHAHARCRAACGSTASIGWRRQGRCVRFAWDVPFAIHFHLHPRRRGADRTAPDGSRAACSPAASCWRLTAAGAALSIEESTHYADVRAAAGPAGGAAGGSATARPRCAGRSSGSTTQNGSMRTADGAGEPAGAAEATEAETGASRPLLHGSVGEPA